MRVPLRTVLATALALAIAGVAEAQSAITYQGRLKLAGAPVTNTCDFKVSLWNAQSGGTQLAGPIDILNVSVDKGLFVITPDFGFDSWDGNARFIQIAVRSPAGGGAYTTLSPRQSVTPVPYALFAEADGNWTRSGANVGYMNGAVGVGTLSPAAPLSVMGPGSGGTTAIFDQPSGVKSIQLASHTGGGNLGTVHDFWDLSGHTAEFASTANGDLVLAPTGSLRLTDGALAQNRVIVNGTGIALGTGLPDPTTVVTIPTPPGKKSVVASEINLYQLDATVIQSKDSGPLYLNPFGNLVQIGGVSGVTPVVISGQVAIGIAAGTSGHKLAVEGSAGRTGGGTTWAVISDRRAKERVATIDAALETIRQVRPVSYRYADWYRAQHPGAAAYTDFSVIAQEFRQVFPDHVHETGLAAPDGSNLLDVDMSPLLPYSVAAIQELDAKNTELEATVAHQADEIAELKERLARLEALLSAQATHPQPASAR